MHMHSGGAPQLLISQLDIHTLHSNMVNVHAHSHNGPLSCAVSRHDIHNLHKNSIFVHELFGYVALGDIYFRHDFHNFCS